MIAKRREHTASAGAPRHPPSQPGRSLTAEPVTAIDLRCTPDVPGIYRAKTRAATNAQVCLPRKILFGRPHPFAVSCTRAGVWAGGPVVRFWGRGAAAHRRPARP
jgi:hypothetical protein